MRMATTWQGFTGDLAIDYIASRRLNAVKCMKVSFRFNLEVLLLITKSQLTEQNELHKESFNQNFVQSKSLPHS